MNKFLIALIVLVGVTVSHAHLTATQKHPVEKHVKHAAHVPTSAELEHKHNPLVEGTDGGHKLQYKDEAGKDACLVCESNKDCACNDIVSIRCEAKRLMQKLRRLKNIANPHAHAHSHGVPAHPKAADHPTPAVTPAVIKAAVLPAPVQTAVIAA